MQGKAAEAAEAVLIDPTTNFQGAWKGLESFWHLSQERQAGEGMSSHFETFLEAHASMITQAHHNALDFSHISFGICFLLCPVQILLYRPNRWQSALCQDE